ncbi:hypothetical protein BGP78_00700 [Pseudoalteromonas sp. MSK9-3]|uniref:hypothetical protein n=1 Tax=Pseudoalteromonas sp. MSK9-3 TaxID=1897633 RepID=UPI000E6D2721|nr:hypothetical protein [Pseudoalteromonas sp. MSK9-3]RJE77555.1 hypothetical protein BGP78_00700 [Pseudoalteromonas sp. MSK9-3]
MFSETTYDCWAYYLPTEAPLEQINISVSDDIAALFKLLYDHGINSQPEQWQRVIFNIKPSGLYSINFEKTTMMTLMHNLMHIWSTSGMVDCN